jgi:hypothetical protein
MVCMVSGDTRRERERERRDEKSKNSSLPLIKKISPRYEFLKLAWMGKRRSYGYLHWKTFLSQLIHTFGYNFLKSTLSTHSKTREGVVDCGS